MNRIWWWATGPMWISSSPSSEIKKWWLRGCARNWRGFEWLWIGPWLARLYHWFQVEMQGSTGWPGWFWRFAELREFPCHQSRTGFRLLSFQGCRLLLAASLLGAPLMHDFAAISLSD